MRPVPSPAPALMLFDGLCSLCCGSVRFVANRSLADQLHFLPMQSEVARPLLRRHGLPEQNFSTMAVIQDGQTLVRSDAALALGRMMRQPWPFLSRIAACLPKPLRDRAYDLIAHNRFRLFGRREECMMPPRDGWQRFRDLKRPV